MPVILGHHAVILDRDYILCSCPEHGCNQVVIELNGAIHQGRRIHRKRYQLHLEAAQPENSPPIPARVQTSLGTSEASMLATSSVVSNFIPTQRLSLSENSKNHITKTDYKVDC